MALAFDYWVEFPLSLGKSSEFNEMFKLSGLAGVEKRASLYSDSAGGDSVTERTLPQACLLREG